MVVIQRRLTHLITPYSRIGATLSPLGPAVVRCDSIEASSVSEEQEQPDTSAPPNRIAAATSWLKVVGRREYKNIM